MGAGDTIMLCVGSHTSSAALVEKCNIKHFFLKWNNESHKDELGQSDPFSYRKTLVNNSQCVNRTIIFLSCFFFL